MELAQRLTGPAARPTAIGDDPFAEVKDRIHKAVISGLSPRLFNTETDPATLRDRVATDVSTEIENEPGIARSDRARLGA